MSSFCFFTHYNTCDYYVSCPHQIYSERVKEIGNKTTQNTLILMFGSSSSRSSSIVVVVVEWRTSLYIMSGGVKILLKKGGFCVETPSYTHRTLRCSHQFFLSLSLSSCPSSSLLILAYCPNHKLPSSRTILHPLLWYYYSISWRQRLPYYIIYYIHNIYIVCVHTYSVIVWLHTR